MRVLLIAPASGRWRLVNRRRLAGGRAFRFSLLSLLTVAAETPAGDEVTIVDEQLEEIPWDAPFDLVGITAMTAAAPRAYEIAATFRARGIPVVLGGMHPTFLPDEALAHADAIVTGESEGIWSEVVEDARRGRLGGIYRSSGTADLSRLHPAPRQLLSRRRYATLQFVEASRGCPHPCTFCSVTAFHGRSYRCRPVADVVADVAAFPERFFIFVDDNIGADRAWARELFRALAPLGKHWMSQATIRITDDAELVALAARSGCVGLFAGLETTDRESLARVRKGFNPAADYRERIAMLHAHGIGLEAGVVVGFDQDGPDCFRRTLRDLELLRVDMMQVSVLTPLPGTQQGREMQPRIHDRDWEHYDYHHVVFEPARMSATDLQAGHDWLTHQLYRPDRIARRLGRLALDRHTARCVPYAAAISSAYWGRIHSWGIRGWDPANGTEATRRAASRAPQKLARV